jgi:hypothetical protein
MEPENLAVIDVESEPIDSTEPENDEIWYSAVQIQGLLKLSKRTATINFQASEHLRIGHPNLTLWRCMSYPILRLALKACKLLNAGKLSELRKLVEAKPAAPSPSQCGSLTISEYTPALDR